MTKDNVEANEIDRLPGELDNDTVIFSYGSLLDHEKLAELLAHRGEFQIFETSDVAEAADLAKDNPKDVVILRDVHLENVRVSIVTEKILRRWYKDRGGDLRELTDTGIATDAALECAYLYARPARAGERGRSLNGGLIFNLTREEVAVLDKYEFEPVLRRTRAPHLKIQGRVFAPEHVAFYAGTESTGDLTREERLERSRLLNLDRKPGRQGPQAKWPHNVRGERETTP
jgi:hypothetical protein